MQKRDITKRHRVAKFAALAAILMLLPGLGLRASQSDVEAQLGPLDDLPVIFIGDQGTGSVRSFDVDGVQLDTTDFRENFGGTNATIEGLAVDYVTVDGQNNPDANVIVADADTTNGFASLALFDAGSAGFGFQARFDSDDILLTGNINTANDRPPTGLSLGAAKDEIISADPVLGHIDIFQHDLGGETPVFYVETIEIEGFSFGDQIALADASAFDVLTDHQDDILVADAISGAVQGFSPSGSSIGQFSGANYQALDGFAAGNIDGFGNDEYVIGRVANGVIDVYTAYFNSGRPEVGSINAGYGGGDAIAVADLTGNGYDEVIFADAQTGQVTIYAYDFRHDPEVTFDEFFPIRSFDAGFDAGDLFAVLPVRYQDLDNDGLYDHWERDGLDADDDGDIDLDLPAFGADPRHKDLFIELDWMEDREPSRARIEALKEAFDDAPNNAGGTFNLDQQPGINLWIDTGNLTEFGQPVGDSFGGGNQVANPAGPVCDTDSQFYAIKKANFDPVRAMVFRYGLLATNQGCAADNTRSGSGEIGGNDFVVFTFDAGTLMHELGHTLNLHHGGFEPFNCKPNYISVMNYDHQFGISQNSGGSIIDFSPPRTLGGSRGAAPLPDLNEDGGLNETLILDGTDPVNQIVYVTPDGAKVRSAVNQPVDWNGDGDTNDTGVRANIDTADKKGNPSNCENSGFALLEGHDDWTNISLPFTQFADSFNGAINPGGFEELTEDELIEIQEGLHTTDLEISVAADPDPAVAGEELVYTLTVTNNGPNPADAVQVIATIPDGAGHLSDDGDCSLDAGALTCDLGVLPANESADVAITLQVDVDLVFEIGAGASLSSTAEVADLAEFASDPNPDNNQIDVETSVVAVTDLEIVSLHVTDAPIDVFVGESGEVALDQVITNNGPSEPVDVLIDLVPAPLSGVTFTPIDNDPRAAVVGEGEQRASDHSFSLECVEPGLQTVVFTSTITPEDEGTSDPNPDNNTATAEVAIDCVLPVAINIKPGETPNLIDVDNPNFIIPLAALTTESGEFELPLAFDAATIDATTVLLGLRDNLFNVADPSGASERDGLGQVEDSIDQDGGRGRGRSGDQGRTLSSDGDLDMLLDFEVDGTGFDEFESEACLLGTAIDPVFGELKFFGCDTVAPAEDVCVDHFTNLLRGTVDLACLPGQQAINFELDGPVTLCVNQLTRQITKAPGAACPANHVSFVLLDQGPLEACANKFTNALRQTSNGACQAIEIPYLID